MNIQKIIAKKRDKTELNKEEINFFVQKYTSGEIADYQAAALVMAIYINGMNDEEIANLSLAMEASGEILDLSGISENIVDKHSTGGVGDKTTLILMPIIASLGIPVAKMSGRGLGFTGGTVDKLQSIPGYRTEINVDEFIENVKNTGISLIGQTANLAPADKKIYALRDTISCTDSIPLIASSIMSKKLASGANKLVIEASVGKGAFTQKIEDAIELSNKMKAIGENAGKEVVCVLTNMDEPLGKNVGNTLEILEVIECLKGNIPEDLREVVLELGSYMIKLAGKGENIEENKETILNQINNGKGFEKFIQLVQNQGGDVSYIQNPEKFAKAKYIYEVKASRSGFIKKLNARVVGETTVLLGAGRQKKEDTIENEVGIVLNKKISDKVEKEEVLAYIHSNDIEKAKMAVDKIMSAYEIVEENVEKEKNILGVIK